MCFITVPLRSINLIKKRVCEHSGTLFEHVRSFTTRSEHEHGILGCFRVLLTGNAHAVYHRAVAKPAQKFGHAMQILNQHDQVVGLALPLSQRWITNYRYLYLFCIEILILSDV